MHFGIGLRIGLLVALAALFAVGFGSGSRADEPILTVSGLPGGKEASFTLESLREMGSSELRTATPWSEGVSTFTGVTGRSLVEALQGAGTEVTADAVNDYHVTIPFDVFNSDTLLIAYARDGEPMPVRDKGPLWVVFPFDSDAVYQSDTYRAYAIWSLIHLEFR